METLHLNLKRKWFDMIASGEKLEEYREIKPYWDRRFIDEKRQNILDATTAFEIAWKNFNTITFKNGYQKDAPTIIVECKGIEIGKAKPEW